MYKTLTFAAALAFLAIGPAMAQQQQQQCNKRDNVLKLLADKYQEAPVAVGVTNNGGLVEVLTTGSGKTWTIIVTSPKGVSCLVAAGEGWRAKEQMAFEPEA
ncbi:MAG: hypothetical protein ACREDZ_08375 [Kiloniellales bacterium]